MPTLQQVQSVAVVDLLVDAAIEVRVARAGGTLEPGVARWMLGKLNRLLDRWNADPAAPFNVGFRSFTPTPNHTPHTIGPVVDGVNPDWLLTTGRPAAITGANLVLTTATPNVRVPIWVRDESWWRAQSVQGLAASVVTDLYYSPDWPWGAVYLWPIPTQAYPIELQTDTLLAAYAAGDTLWLPFGYRDAVTLTLAEECASGLGQEPTQTLLDSARDARVVIFGHNVQTRNLRTRDGGMPGGRRGGRYLYRTGRTR